MKKHLPILLILPMVLGACGKQSGPKKGVTVTDYSLQYKENFKILHLTDTQIINSAQRRYDKRLDENSIELYKAQNLRQNLLNIMDEMVERVGPDLITLGGDNVYGEFDDNGSSLKALVKHLDKYKIPYTFVYGNHDNESNLGRNAQNAIWQASDYCMYRDGVNTIGLYDENNNVKRIIYMFDSNGCSNASIKSVEDGVLKVSLISGEEMDLFEEMQEKIEKNNLKDVPSTFIQHIMPRDVYEYLQMAEKVPVPYTHFEVEDESSDYFGGCYEEPSIMSDNMIDIYDRFNCDTAFYGHDHVNNLSVKINNIRFTYMMKSSYYDYHREGMIGGTVSEISNDGKEINVHHEYYQTQHL